MEFAQESVTTLHDFGAADPDAPIDRASVLVPMIGREHGTAAAERLFEGLESVQPYEVVVPLRANAQRAVDIASWLDEFAVPIRIIWCSGPRLNERLGLSTAPGKGRDMWVGVGAARGDYLVCHDADAATYSPTDTRKLLAPLGMGVDSAPQESPQAGYSFVKGYYARVENGRLYGRLTRLLYEPLIDAIAARHTDPVLSYLGAFRYALAGECAMTAEMARRMPVHPRWGFEVGTLGAAFDHAGPAGSAQVDLGLYEHEHRSVEGPGGLASVSDGVANALFHTLADHGVPLDFRTLPERYRRSAHRLIRAYAADAAFNSLQYDPSDERRQVEQYARSIVPPDGDARLSSWAQVDIDRGTLLRVTNADLEAATDASAPGTVATVDTER